MITLSTANRVREMLQSKQAKAIAIDLDIPVDTVYRIKAGRSWRVDIHTQIEVQRIFAVTKRLESNPYAPIKGLVRASMVTFKGLKDEH